MLKPHPIQRFVVTLSVAALSLSLAGAAVADTIYLKNGRVIRSSSVRVEGDKVYFVQYGGTVALPMAVVDRIEQDANVEPPSTPVTQPVAQDPADAGTAAGGEGGEGDAAAADAAAEDEVPLEQTEAYWQEQVRTIAAEKERTLLQIEDLRRQERAFLFSHRSTAETRQAIEMAQQRIAELDANLAELQTEARRLGVPPGWLRVPAGAGGGGESGGGSGMGAGGSGR